MDGAKRRRRDAAIRLAMTAGVLLLLLVTGCGTLGLGESQLANVAEDALIEATAKKLNEQAGQEFPLELYRAVYQLAKDDTGVMTILAKLLEDPEVLAWFVAEVTGEWFDLGEITGDKRDQLSDSASRASGNWKRGPFDFDVTDQSETWECSIQCKDAERDRPKSGKPERMYVRFYFADGGYYGFYIRVGKGEPMFRYRLNNVAHESDNDNMGNVPHGEFSLSWKCDEGKIAAYLNGERMHKPAACPGALKRVSWSWHSPRPAGVDYRSWTYGASN